MFKLPPPPKKKGGKERKKQKYSANFLVFWKKIPQNDIGNCNSLLHQFKTLH